MWYSIAQETWARPGARSEGKWILEKIGVDFLKEVSGWKLWHLMTAVDLSVKAGDDYREYPIYEEPHIASIREEFGHPTVEMIVHDNMFNWWDNYPPLPKPYSTFTDGMGYGPDGYKPPEITNLKAGEGRNYK
jgi:hypothetical protein